MKKMYKHKLSTNTISYPYYNNYLTTYVFDRNNLGIGALLLRTSFAATSHHNVTVQKESGGLPLETGKVESL